MVYFWTRSKSWVRVVVKGVKYMVTKENFTLGGGHTMQRIGDISRTCTIETYKILGTNVTSINLT